MTAYYNEFDPFAAAWLRNLIDARHIAPGDVDERSIKDVHADDLRGYTQCHFFAGIGVWSHALRRSGWADDRPVWTGSCPCQPFSLAGAGAGFEDPRHLWPDWLRLIRQRRPDTIFGEQVASAGAWLDLVQTDLEADGFAVGAVDLPAAGFAGAHIRQRFMWVADRHDTQRRTDLARGHDGYGSPTGRLEGHGQPGTGGDAVGLGDDDDQRGNRGNQSDEQAGWGKSSIANGIGRLDEPNGGHPSTEGLQRSREHRQQPTDDVAGARCDWIFCRDGKLRPVETGTFPLAPTSPGRVGLLRGYGNAIDAEVATNFVTAYMEVLEGCELPDFV